MGKEDVLRKLMRRNESPFNDPDVGRWARNFEVENNKVKTVYLVLTVRSEGDTGEGYVPRGTKPCPIMPYIRAGNSQDIEREHLSRPDIVGAKGEILAPIIATGYLNGTRYAVVVEVGPHPSLEVVTEPRRTSSSIRRLAQAPEPGEDMFDVYPAPPLGEWYNWVSDYELVFSSSVGVPQNYAADRVKRPLVRRIA